MILTIRSATLGALLLTMFGCVALRADSVSGGTLTAFPSLGSAASPTYGNAYWNNASGDGPAANIGWCLTGGGQCTLPGVAPGALQYYSATGSAGANNAPTDLYFTTGGNNVNTNLLVSLTDQNPNDTFGWYSINPDGTRGALHSLFVGDQAGMSATFSPSGNYGFYIAQQQGASSDPFSSTYYFFMNSAFNYTGGNDPNNPGDSLQHFALFQQNANSYYLGVSDTRACQGSVTSSCTDPAAFDYNDPVVQVQFVPEPMSGALVGAGLILAAGLFRKRTNV